MRPEHRQQALVFILGISILTGGIIFATSDGGILRLFPAAILLIAGGAAAFFLTPSLDRTFDSLLDPRSAPTPRSDVPVETWTPREVQILALIAQGCTNDEIADELVISRSTVKTHINNVYRKLEVRNRVEAVARARALNLV